MFTMLIVLYTLTNEIQTFRDSENRFLLLIIFMPYCVNVTLGLSRSCSLDFFTSIIIYETLVSA